MRRSRFRSSFRPGFNSSRFGSRGFYVRGAPLKGPVGMIFAIGMIAFVGFFILNFLLLFFYDDYFDTFGIVLFFVPFGIMVVLVPTMIIASFITAAQAAKDPQAMLNSASNASGSMPNQDLGLLAKQAGYKMTTLPWNDPSTAQLILDNEKKKILVKILAPNVLYKNDIAQDLSKGLGQYLAQEAWVVQTPTSFTENDLNFARFYNVQLLSPEAAQKLLLPNAEPTLTK
jgi:hypothetical protein